MQTFERRFLAVLAERGVTIDDEGQFVRIPRSGSSVTDAQLRYMNARQPDHEVEAVLKHNWVLDLAETAEVLQREGTSAQWPYRTAFWLRLHGVLSDLRKETLDFFRLAEIDPATYVPSPRSDLALLLDKHRCIERIHKQFNDDELIYADYLRQTNSHPVQRGYGVRWSDGNGGQVNDRRRISTLGREFTVEELDAAIQRVLHANLVDGRVNENAIAVRFAGRVLSVIGPLVEVMHRLGIPDSR